MENVVELYDLKKDIFTMSLPREIGEIGTMTIGYAKQELYFGDILYHDVILKPYWTLKLNGVYLNGQDTGVCKDGSCGVIIDSGSSYNAIPTSFMKTLISKNKGNPIKLGNCWKEIDFMESETPWGSCSNYLAYPTITYVIDHKEYSLEPWEYLTLIGEDFYTTYDPDVEKEDIEDCYLNFSTFDYEYGGMELWLIGDTLMSKLYSVFDYGNERVGFAVHVTEAEE